MPWGKVFVGIMQKLCYPLTTSLNPVAYIIVQANLNSSNMEGSFTMADLNSFLSPYEILPLAQENKYLGKFSYFIMKLYVVCTH